MKFAAKLASGFVALAALAAPSLSNASLVFTITRISDSQAQVTGSGTLDMPIVSGILGMSGANSMGDSGIDPSSGVMSIGGVNVVYAYARVDQTYFSLDFRQPVFAGGELTGSLLVDLDVESWAPIGTTGDVFAEGGSSIGTYSIVGASAVPEPGSLALLGLGLVGLAASRKRKLA